MQRAWTAPLAAVLGLLALFALPAAAQAHHVDSKAECVIDNGSATVRLTASFIGFGSTGSKAVTGKVKVDGVEQFNGLVPITWTGNNGTWVKTFAAQEGKSAAIRTDWSWSENGKPRTDGESLTTNSCPVPPRPAIELVKSGAGTADAGDTFTYSFAATNTGSVTLGNVALTDAKCQSTLTRDPAETDTTFDTGDVWHYTCTVIAPADPAEVVNVAEVCGDHGDTKVCDEDEHTFTVPPADTPPVSPQPPAETPPATTPPSTTPAGQVLPAEVASGRAALRGPSGCVKQAFRARVRGRSIASVTFLVDGRRVKRATGRDWSVRIDPERYGFGRHRVVAKVRFRAASGTAPRQLPLTFRRCAQGAVAPQFTG